MGEKLKKRVEEWKKLLLDTGKRNGLINFRRQNSSNIQILKPSFQELFAHFVVQEKNIVFPHTEKKVVEKDGKEENIEIVVGDVETSKSIEELQRTLLKLRYKVHSTLEERGINILYLTFGLLNWKESDNSEQVISSPLILVPVKIIAKSLSGPYSLALYEDEIVVNPTLAHKLHNDFSIRLPEFDNTEKLPDYFDKLNKAIRYKDWTIDYQVYLTCLSFLKINMYKDLELNEALLNNSQIISTLVGESPCISIPDEYQNVDYDKQVRPIDTFQVLDADSSQQDAIYLSKKGVSFVLQGPPGTGKSQTITNIITEALADGKKILFVSEKMAALNVVYSRLVSVGLEDFCLLLHSHKADKKTIINNLHSSLLANKSTLQGDILSDLNELENQRRALNEYHTQLHTQCSELNISIFYVNGKLAQLENIPDVIFPISDVDKETGDSLSLKKKLLEDLSKIIAKRTEDYIVNPWRNSNVKFLSFELRHDIDSYIAKILPPLEELYSNYTQSCNRIGLSPILTWHGLEDTINLLEFVKGSPMIPFRWILEGDIEGLQKQAKQYEVLVKAIKILEEERLSIFKESIFQETAESIKKKLEVLRNESFFLSKKIYLEVENINQIDSIDNVKRAIIDISNVLKGIDTTARNISNLLGCEAPRNLKNLNILIDFCRLLNESGIIYPTESWFDSFKFNQIKNSIDAYKSAHELIIGKRNDITKNFDKEIFDFEFYPLLQRFRSDYNSFLRIFKASYRNDIKLLKGYLSGDLKLDYNSSLQILNELKDIDSLNDELHKHEPEYTEDFGRYYNGLETQWDMVESVMCIFEKLLSAVHALSFSLNLQELLSKQDLPQKELSQFLDLYDKSSLPNIYSQLSSLLKMRCDENTAFEEIILECQNISEHIQRFSDTYTSVKAFLKQPLAFENLLPSLEKVVKEKEMRNRLCSENETLLEVYGNYYDDVNTDWEELDKALIFADDLKEKKIQKELSDEFIKNVCENSDFVLQCGNISNQMISAIKELYPSFDWFLNLFFERDEFLSCEFSDMIARITLCKEKKYLLEEWVDYRNNKEKCKKFGLEPFIEQIERISIDPNQIVAAYLKRFYRLWLDAMLPHFPAVRDFRGRIQNQTIQEFCRLDTLQFEIAKRRVKERIVNSIPNFNNMTSADNEISILKREANKHRKIMSLRRLFAETPNVLMSLKPCFLMSPLSVSEFLAAKNYMFDLVIFDEASQVHTENAIGAIMRAKQAIIVGDTKQLPPTNFFATLIANNNLDDGNIDDFESILDEAATVLPEITLRWHYRSRHEDLIAFSNIKIYKGSLITFPSTIEKSKDNGVEYIYVENGVYDRSGKRNNENEAKRVAELIFEHFRKYPKRSLGVVTFNESQQDTIDSYIRKMRLKNPQYERFFQEDVDEAFFIKNLENVQGDERDTIILSIGFAKDSSGVMSMNFGPLNQSGGYRRLNVAITRAKYNLKLVGSINASDIDIERTNSEGVHLLRSYIEFAQRGIEAIRGEITYNPSTINCESPFEEAVYNFLSSEGYRVETQVGCSGYRIDMAVKHPYKNGEFILGIECDGATYHSSRTARERDRLRQSVLESMGWKFYRIWSTDWIKDTSTEKEKLLQAIKDVYPTESLDEREEVVVEESKKENTDEDLEITIETKAEEECEAEEATLPVSIYGFTFYQLADVTKYRLLKKTNEETILKVIRIEQPIHVEELYKRVAPLFDNQKVTSKVRENVDLILKRKIAGQLQKDGDYYMLKDFTDIKVRIPNADSDYKRRIDYIYPKELKLAILRIVQENKTMNASDLLITTAREFGFKRTSEGINRIIRDAINSLIKEKLLKQREDRVAINDSPQQETLSFA